jgi:hypothetical protein
MRGTAIQFSMRDEQPGGIMKRIVFATSVLAASILATQASAGPIDVSARLTGTPNGSNFDYTIVLKNSSSSTDSIKTFWYSWVPGADFLGTSPISVTPPTGWVDHITHFPNVPTNGFAIQFVTSTAPLAPGNSLSFMFTSAETPSQLAGNSPFYPGTPIGTSFVYSGAPFQGDSLQFTVTSAPEPSSLALAGLGSLGVVGYAWRRRLRKPA